MKSTIALFIALLAQSTVVLSDPSCPENQYYSDGGPTCPYLQCTGESQGVELCLETFVPVAGCFCDKGFYRSCDGGCVPETECAATDDCGIRWPDEVEQ